MFNFYRKLKLRFFQTDALYAALDLLARGDSKDSDIRRAKLLIANELVRRNEIFWEA